MNKSLGIANQSQRGRMKLLGLIGLQLLTAAIIIAASVLAFTHYREHLQFEVEEDLLAVVLADVVETNHEIRTGLKTRPRTSCTTVRCCTPPRG